MRQHSCVRAVYSSISALEKRVGFDQLFDISRTTRRATREAKKTDLRGRTVSELAGLIAS